MQKNLKKNSKEYHVITQFLNKIKNSSDDIIKKSYQEGKLVYLDDNYPSMQEFISIIQQLTETLFQTAPNHLKGDFKEITEREVKDLLGEYEILIYGRSGMRINSLELKKYE